MSRKQVNINWDKSYMLTAAQVGLLGLEDTSVAELKTGSKHIPDLARLADAMDHLTVGDIRTWAEDHPAALTDHIIEVAAKDKAKRIRE